jgi:hypothetical protein
MKRRPRIIDVHRELEAPGYPPCRIDPTHGPCDPAEYAGSQFCPACRKRYHVFPGGLSSPVYEWVDGGIERTRTTPLVYTNCADCARQGKSSRTPFRCAFCHLGTHQHERHVCDRELHDADDPSRGAPDRAIQVGTAHGGPE